MGDEHHSNAVHSNAVHRHANRMSGDPLLPVTLPFVQRVATESYRRSARTARTSSQVLEGLAGRQVPGVAVTERGPSYLVLQPPARRGYPLEAGVALVAVAIVLVLVATAVSPVLIVLLPAAAMPVLPFMWDRRPSLAVSALPDPDGVTRINAHGEASVELAAALDGYLGELPPPAETARAATPGAEGSSAAGVLPVGRVRLPADPTPSAEQREDAAAVLFDPGCSSCREVCRLLDAAGVPVTLIRYREDVLSRADMERIAGMLEIDDVRTMMRTGEPAYVEFGIAETTTRGDLLDAITAHPELLQRPIVIRGGRAVIALPTDRVNLLLEGSPPAS